LSATPYEQAKGDKTELLYESTNVDHSQQHPATIKLRTLFYPSIWYSSCLW